MGIFVFDFDMSILIFLVVALGIWIVLSVMEIIDDVKSKIVSWRDRKKKKEDKSKEDK